MKSITIVMYELKKEIIEKINESGLPEEVIKYVIVDIANSVSELAQHQLQEELEKETKDAEN